MIRIATSTNRYETPSFTHPAQTGVNFVLYTFTHNFNDHPDVVEPMVFNAASQKWLHALPTDTDGSNYYGWEMLSATQTADKNQSSLRIYNQGPTQTMKVVFIKFS
jgi:hypothetical protein